MQEIKNVIDKNAKIAVLAGGMSSEHDVSMRSVKDVLKLCKDWVLIMQNLLMLIKI